MIKSPLYNAITKAISFLSAKEKKRLRALGLFFVLTALFDIAGVASIVPFMTVVTDPDKIETNEYLLEIYKTLKFSSPNSFLIFLGFCSFLLIALGNMLKLTETYVMYRFGFMQTHHLSKRLLRNYLYRPYEYFLTQHSSVITNHVLGEVEKIVHGVYLPALKVFSRLIVLIAIISLLMIVNWKLTLSATVFLGGVYVLIYAVLKRRIGKWGDLRAEKNSERFKLVTEISGAIKLIKFSNTEEKYLERFDSPSLYIARALTNTSVLAEAPRFLLEFLGFGGIVAIMIYFLGTQGSGHAIAMASFYAFAGYRLIPAMQVVYAGVSKINYMISAIDRVAEQFENSGYKIKYQNQDFTPINFKKSIIFKNVTYQYANTNEPAIKNANFTINKNEIVGIVGPTGSGKSTLADILLGLLSPSSGKILVDDIELNEESYPSFKSLIGYVPQQIFLLDDTIIANITCLSPDKNIEMERVKHAAKLAQIDQFIETDLVGGYMTTVGERGIRLSGGQIQRIGIARALYNEPKILVFDEATSALDNATEQELIKAIENLSKNLTIIMVAHRLSTLKSANKKIYLRKEENQTSIKVT